MPEPEGAAVDAALRIIHHWARARLAIIEPKADFTAKALGYDADDVFSLLLTVDRSCVFDVSPDHAFPERTVLEMKVATGEALLYVKVSLRLDKDYNVKVLSFKRYGT